MPAGDTVQPSLMCFPWICVWHVGVMSPVPSPVFLKHDRTIGTLKSETTCVSTLTSFVDIFTDYAFLYGVTVSRKTFILKTFAAPETERHHRAVVGLRVSYQL